MRKGIKIAALLLAAVMAVTSLCSCRLNLKKHFKIPSMNFSAEAQVNYKSYDVLSCTVSNTEDGPLNIEVKKPALLSGLTLICNGESCTIKYGAVSYEADTQKYPQLSFANTLKQSVNSIKDDTELTQNEDGSWSLKTKINSSDVLVTLDGETHYPTRIEVPSEELIITFTSFAEVEQTEAAQTK